MSNKGGVLGESTTATAGTNTAYTVPSGKWAKVRFMFRGIAGTNSTLALNANGVALFTTAAMSSGSAIYSSTGLPRYIDAPANIDGSTEAKTVMPYAREYFLSAGDTVTYTIGTADMQSINVQVVGVELDV